MKDKLNLMNRLDNEERWRGFVTWLCDEPGQSDSHGYSYMNARRIYQMMGETMGLDKSIAINERSKYGFNQGIKRK